MAKKADDPVRRTNQVIFAAMDLAERQILDGTASSQVITHFLKLAGEEEALKREKLEAEIELLKSKVALNVREDKVETLLSEAMVAFKKYNGDYDE